MNTRTLIIDAMMHALSKSGCIVDINKITDADNVFVSLVDYNFKDICVCINSNDTNIEFVSILDNGNFILVGSMKLLTNEYNMGWSIVFDNYDNIVDFTNSAFVRNFINVFKTEISKALNISSDSIIVIKDIDKYNETVDVIDDFVEYFKSSINKNRYTVVYDKQNNFSSIRIYDILDNSNLYGKSFYINFTNNGVISISNYNNIDIDGSPLIFTTDGVIKRATNEVFNDKKFMIIFFYLLHFYASRFQGKYQEMLISFFTIVLIKYSVGNTIDAKIYMRKTSVTVNVPKTCTKFVIDYNEKDRYIYIHEISSDLIIFSMYVDNGEINIFNRHDIIKYMGPFVSFIEYLLSNGNAQFKQVFVESLSCANVRKHFPNEYKVMNLHNASFSNNISCCNSNNLLWMNLNTHHSQELQINQFCNIEYFERKGANNVNVIFNTNGISDTIPRKYGKNTLYTIYAINNFLSTNIKANVPKMRGLVDNLIISDLLSDDESKTPFIAYNHYNLIFVLNKIFYIVSNYNNMMIIYAIDDNLTVDPVLSVNCNGYDDGYALRHSRFSNAFSQKHKGDYKRIMHAIESSNLVKVVVPFNILGDYYNIERISNVLNTPMINMVKSLRKEYEYLLLD